MSFKTHTENKAFSINNALLPNHSIQFILISLTFRIIHKANDLIAFNTGLYSTLMFLKFLFVQQAIVSMGIFS